MFIARTFCILVSGRDKGVKEVSAEQMVIKLALEISSFAESANQNLFTVRTRGH